jgi:hypothetical protein
MTGIQQQNRSATMQTGMYSESQDSTGGSFWLWLHGISQLLQV